MNEGRSRRTLRVAPCLVQPSVNFLYNPELVDMDALANLGHFISARIGPKRVRMCGALGVVGPTGRYNCPSATVSQYASYCLILPHI